MEHLTFDQLPNAISQLGKKLESIERLLLQKATTEPTEASDKLLTVNEAAEFLTLAVPTIYTMVHKGELPVMKRSKRLYFSRVELTEYLKAGRKKTNSEIEGEAEEFIKSRRAKR